MPANLSWVSLKSAGYSHRLPTDVRHELLEKHIAKNQLRFTREQLVWRLVRNALLNLARLHKRAPARAAIYQQDADWIAATKPLAADLDAPPSDDDDLEQWMAPERVDLADTADEDEFVHVSDSDSEPADQPAPAPDSEDDLERYVVVHDDGSDEDEQPPRSPHIHVQVSDEQSGERVHVRLSDIQAGIYRQLLGIDPAKAEQYLRHIHIINGQEPPTPPVAADASALGLRDEYGDSDDDDEDALRELEALLPNAVKAEVEELERMQMEMEDLEDRQAGYLAAHGNVAPPKAKPPPRPANEADLYNQRRERLDKLRRDARAAQVQLKRRILSEKELEKQAQDVSSQESSWPRLQWGGKGNHRRPVNETEYRRVASERLQELRLENRARRLAVLRAEAADKVRRALAASKHPYVKAKEFRRLRDAELVKLRKAERARVVEQRRRLNELPFYESDDDQPTPPAPAEGKYDDAPSSEESLEAILDDKRRQQNGRVPVFQAERPQQPHFTVPAQPEPAPEPEPSDSDSDAGSGSDSGSDSDSGDDLERHLDPVIVQPLAPDPEPDPVIVLPAGHSYGLRPRTRLSYARMGNGGKTTPSSKRPRAKDEAGERGSKRSRQQPPRSKRRAEPADDLEDALDGPRRSRRLADKKRVKYGAGLLTKKARPRRPSPSPSQPPRCPQPGT